MSAAPYRLGFIGAGKLAGSVIRGLLLKNFLYAGRDPGQRAKSRDARAIRK